MNIGLIDVDGHHFPNFALMKISAWHKAHGDSVEWAVPDLFGDEYHRVYASKIFTFTPDFVGRYGCEVIKGGTGYDIHSKLLEEIDRSTAMDYSIYPQYPFSIQFFSRGCIRRCPPAQRLWPWPPSRYSSLAFTQRQSGQARKRRAERAPLHIH